MSATKLSLNLPITKVDTEKRTITGVATGEWKDAHGQIVDYATAKKCFDAWPGNIREMHQPIAAGHAVGVEFDDTTKSITVTSYISKGAESTWQKILDGTLRDYSIGGSGEIKMEKTETGTVQKIYLAELNELSVVDVGALPGSTLSLVKMVDGAVQVVAPADEPPAPEPAKVEKVADSVVVLDGAGLMSILRDVLKAQGALVKTAAPTLEPIAKLADVQKVKVTKYIESYDLYSAMAALQWLEDLIASEYYDLVYPGEEGNEADKRAQLDVLRAAAKLVLAFLNSEFDQQFAALDAEAAPEAVAMFKAAVESAQVQKAIGEWPASFSALDGSGKLVFIGKAGARHSKADVAMIQAMHDTAITLGAACAAPVDKALDLEGVKAFLVEKAASTDDTIKAGIAEIVKMLTPTPATEPIDKAATAPTGLTADQVQKMIDTALTTSTEKITKLESTIAEQKATIEKQQQDFETFKAQPAPGGPVTRAVAPGSVAVDKSIGNAAITPENAPAPADVIATLAKMAETATPEVRKWLAESAIRVQQSGAGVISVQR